MQKDGENYHANAVTYQFSDTMSEIEMDIAAAYPAECGLLSYRRNASLIKGKEIIIKDCFAIRGSAPVQLSLMTYEKPTLQETQTEENRLTFSIGSLSSLHIIGGTLSGIEEIPITDARLQTAWEHEIYRILIDAADTEITMRIS